MVKMTIVPQTDEEGNVQELDPTPRTSSSGGQYSYDTVSAGFYQAVVTKLEEGFFKGSYGDIVNPESEDGKWDYVKVTPTFDLQHRAEVDGESVITKVTRINQQDFPIGVMDSTGALYNPKQNGKSPIFSDARFLLQNLGLFRKEGANLVLDFDASIIKNRVLLVRVSYAAYAKRDRNRKTLSLNAEKFKEWAQQKLHVDVSDMKYHDLKSLVDAYNEDYSDTEFGEGDDYKLVIKNEIVWSAALKEEDIEEYGYYLDPETHQVFVSQDDYNTYLLLKELSDDETDAIL